MLNTEINQSAFERKFSENIFQTPFNSFTTPNLVFCSVTTYYRTPLHHVAAVFPMVTLPYGQKTNFHSSCIHAIISAYLIMKAFLIFRTERIKNCSKQGRRQLRTGEAFFTHLEDIRQHRTRWAQSHCLSTKEHPVYFVLNSVTVRFHARSLNAPQTGA